MKIVVFPKRPLGSATALLSGSSFNFADFLGCQSRLEAVVTNHETGPSGFSSQANHQKFVVGIDKPLKVISNRDGSAGGT